MSYQVFARKWRPQVFEDVIGQGHITRTLQNAIATNRLAHAFLFSGPGASERPRQHAFSPRP